MDEKTLESCVLLLHQIFVLGTDPSVTFMNHLEPIMIVLLELHCSVTYGVSHLKGPVQDLVKRFLKCSSNAEAVGTLRAFAFRQAPESKVSR